VSGNRTGKKIAEIIKNGHPPMANKVVLIDFDGTLYPFGHMFNEPEPLEGAREFLVRLKEDGFKIGIFTSRLSPRWLKTENQDIQRHRRYIREILKRDKIPFDFMTAEKIPAEFYIDDKAVTFTGDWEVTKKWYENRS
jgi:FMN phosphatase YigB (HAD superfamily)